MPFIRTCKIQLRLNELSDKNKENNAPLHLRKTGKIRISCQVNPNTHNPNVHTILFGIRCRC